MNWSTEFIMEFIIVIAVFSILFIIGKRIYKRIETHDSRILNIKEYFPDEEITTLRQVFYLIMILLFFITLLYALIYTQSDSIGFCYLELVLMLYIAITMEYDKWTKRLFFILLIPYGSLTFILFGRTLVSLLDLIHVPVLIYLMKVYFDKFWHYTETNGLGITIILLFSIVFFSFVATMFVEGVEPIDAIVMVSNAFTSNGYAVLGSTSGGKLNSILLVWSGYIISGVATATLAAAIVIKRFKIKLEKTEKALKKENEELKEIIKQSNEELKEMIEKIDK